jgi:hypothetical protein
MNPSLISFVLNDLNSVSGSSPMREQQLCIRTTPLLRTPAAGAVASPLM